MDEKCVSGGYMNLRQSHNLSGSFMPITIPDEDCTYSVLSSATGNVSHAHSEPFVQTVTTTTAATMIAVRRGRRMRNEANQAWASKCKEAPPLALQWLLSRKGGGVRPVDSLRDTSLILKQLLNLLLRLSKYNTPTTWWLSTCHYREIG